MNKIKSGRPTDSVKDNLLKIRVENDTLEKIDNIAKVSKLTRSEIVREILPIISSKDFEDMISLGSLKRFEEYSSQCIEYFDKPRVRMRRAAVSVNFPAFVSDVLSL